MNTQEVEWGVGGIKFSVVLSTSGQIKELTSKLKCIISRDGFNVLSQNQAADYFLLKPTISVQQESPQTHC